VNRKLYIDHYVKIGRPNCVNCEGWGYRLERHYAPTPAGWALRRVHCGCIRWPGMVKDNWLWTFHGYATKFAHVAQD